MQPEEAGMDDLDEALVALLRANGRASVSELAARLGVTRATVRAREAKLRESGVILGYAAVLRSAARELPVRAITMLEVEGKKGQAVARALGGIPEVRSVHTTNGRWDLALEIAAVDLPQFDAALARVRMIEGVAGSETSLLLTPLKTGGAG